MSRSRDLALLVGALAAVTVSGGMQHAVANKISKDAGRGEFQTVGGFIRAIFKDPEHQDSVFVLFTALVALLFLAAVVTIGLGALQAVRGDRGGIDTMFGGAYGLVALLVMFGVIL